MARARNQPRSTLAWTLCLVLLFSTVFLLSLRVAEGATPLADEVRAGPRLRGSAPAAPPLPGSTPFDPGASPARPDGVELAHPTGVADAGEIADLAGIDPAEIDGHGAAELPDLASEAPGDLDPADLDLLDPADRAALAQVWSWLDPDRSAIAGRSSSWLGRVELSLTWRRATAWDEPVVPGVAADTLPIQAAVRTELWVIARWSR